jgi:hypothetical protein
VIGSWFPFFAARRARLEPVLFYNSSGSRKSSNEPVEGNASGGAGGSVSTECQGRRHADAYLFAEAK